MTDVLSGRIARRAVLLAFVAACGCFGSRVGQPRAEVKGMVLLDGEPLAEGSITFHPIEGNPGPTAGSGITNGRYHVLLGKGPGVGEHKVAISAVRKTGRRVSDPLSPGKQVDQVEEVVPAKFNTESTLIRQLAAGPNTLDFDLKSR